MYYINNEKEETTPGGRNGTAHKEKIQNDRRIGSLQRLKIIRSPQHQISGDERKKKSISWVGENSKPNDIAGTLQKGLTPGLSLS